MRQGCNLVAIRLGLRDNRGADGVAVADTHHSMLQVLVLLLARLDRGETEQELVVSCLLLAHRWVVSALGYDSCRRAL